MDNELLYIWLSGINGIGSVLGKRLINHFGNIENLYKAREIIRNSNYMSYYEPQNYELWDKEYERFKNVIKSMVVIKC